MRLNKPAIRQSGRILFQGVDLNQLTEQEMRKKGPESVHDSPERNGCI